MKHLVQPRLARSAWVALAFAFGLSLACGASVAACVGGLPPTNPDRVYAVHDDGTVTDTRTGLMWKRCPEGQNWVDGDCLSTPRLLSWEDAHQRARESDFAGYGDWRLPNIVELHTLVERCTAAPAINRTIFPGVSTGYGVHYLSSTPKATHPGAVWTVDFRTGTLTSDVHRVRRPSRLVRDALPGGLPANTPAASTQAPANGAGSDMTTSSPIRLRGN